MWEHQVKQFAGAYRTIVPDLRGFGDSPPAGDAVRMEDFADDLKGLLDGLGVNEPVVLCGLSMGGYIAWQFIRKYPDRVRTLVVCDSKAAADTPEAAQNRHKLADQVLLEGTEPVEKAFLPKLLAPTTYDQKPQLVDTVREMIRRASPHGVAAALRGMAARPDVTGDLKNIRKPVLLIGGSQDGISPPKEMSGIASAIAGARFVEVPDAGHLAPMENATAVNQALASVI
jgi:pimeloyl-ACP methyl ester carboxylesterase